MAAMTNQTSPDVVSRSCFKTGQFVSFSPDVIELYYSERSCSEDSFSCAGGGCLSWSFTCDGKRNCEDGTDEPSICGVFVLCTTFIV